MKEVIYVETTTVEPRRKAHARLQEYLRLLQKAGVNLAVESISTGRFSPASGGDSDTESPDSDDCANDKADDETADTNGQKLFEQIFHDVILKVFKERSRRLADGLIDGRQVVIALESVEYAVGVARHVTVERDAEGTVKGGVIGTRAFEELGDIAGVLLVMLAPVFTLISHVITTLAK